MCLSGRFILLYEHADARCGLIWVFVAVCVEDSARIVLSENIILCVCVFHNALSLLDGFSREDDGSSFLKAMVVDVLPQWSLYRYYAAGFTHSCFVLVRCSVRRSFVRSFVTSAPVLNGRCTWSKHVGT